MGWATRKLDNLGSAAAGGAGGISLSQAPAFTHAYLQRLGGHIDEARRTVAQLTAGDLLPYLAPADRAEAVAALGTRVEELEQARAAIDEAHPLLQPLMLVRHADPHIASAAFEAFTPALPLDVASLTWIGIGVVAALVVYELIKSPGALLRRRRRQERHLQSRGRRR